jgi:hypothetical protein
MLGENFQFYIGEVINYVDTFKEDSLVQNTGFQIEVYIIKDGNKIPISNVKPANNNIKQIPIKGEQVLVFRGYDQNSSFFNKTPQWYYLSTISVQTSINNNILPVNTIQSTFVKDDEYTPVNVSPLQPYAGDILIEGRWGNSIRLGSTSDPASPRYSITPNWAGDIKTDPIIVLSNNIKQQDQTKFRVEDVTTDTSALYLTSTQKIKNLVLSNTLSCFRPGESEYSKSQFIGIGSRIILKATSDIVVIDSPVGIVLGTVGELRIGNDEADESMVHGNVLVETLQYIINQIQAPIVAGSSLGKFMDYTNANKAQKKLQSLLSSKYFIKKNTY